MDMDMGHDLSIRALPRPMAYTHGGILERNQYITTTLLHSMILLSIPVLFLSL